MRVPFRSLRTGAQVWRGYASRQSEGCGEDLHAVSLGTIVIILGLICASGLFVRGLRTVEREPLRNMAWTMVGGFNAVLISYGLHVTPPGFNPVVALAGVLIGMAIISLGRVEAFFPPSQRRDATASPVRFRPTAYFFAGLFVATCITYVCQHA